MIAEFGHFALVCALCVCLVQAGAGLAGANLTSAGFLRVADMSARAQFGLVLIAFGALTYSFVVSDFSLAVVHANGEVGLRLTHRVARRAGEAGRGAHLSGVFGRRRGEAE